MTTKVKKKITHSNFVRITIDDFLAEAINQTKAELPMLSSVEAIKVLISRGAKNNKIVVRKKTKNISQIIEEMQQKGLFHKLSPKYDYKDSYKEAYHKMLDEKYGF